LARSGSKGLPNKHLLPFNGKPLIEWTIWNAKDFAKTTDADIVVSSDSDKIIDIASNLGVDTESRNPMYALDTSGKVDAIRDTCKRVEERPYNPKTYGCIIDLDATNPCRTVEDIQNAYNVFCDKRPKTLFSVVKAKKNPSFNQISYFKDYGRYFTCINGITANQRVRRQDCPEVFDLNSNIYIYSKTFLENKDIQSVITNNSEIYLMPEWTANDIDNEVDFQVAEFLHNKYILKKDGDVQSKKQDCSCSGWHGPDRFSGHGCATQARGIYIND
jgi:CMP-N-acetylneuraminic acid synthetase